MRCAADGLGGAAFLLDDGARGGEPVEDDALFLGVHHFALGARHVGAVAAVEAG